MFAPVDPKKPLPKMEHEMLEFWEKENIFKKSLENRKDGKKFVFFDGPPFANGLPHYGHILANTIKDAVTRYMTMKGFYVPRTNGWDCHGLPVEYEIEKELKLNGKKEIEAMGIAKFNAACRESVFRYTEEWEKLLKRIGRWVDFEKSYATLDNEYMESIWWVFKSIWDKKMMYQDYKSMHICPRCETPLSNFEVTLGYKEVTDPSVVVKFRLKNEKNTFALAWTTTPWTLPGNALLAVGPEIEYVKVESEGDQFVLAKKLLANVFGEREHKIVKTLSSKDLNGLPYEPLFPYYKTHKNAFRIVTADFVTTEDGTGIVHIAPGFGDDDMQVGRREKVEPIMHVKMDGTFEDKVTNWAGKFVKGQELNIKDYLEQEGKLFSFKNYPHSYPHCWRCDTPLLNYSTKGWFIKVTDIKKKLLKNNKKIHWQPEHIQEGRFGKWLEGARDWNISRNRFWGCPIPIWECNKCGDQSCIGSVKELREKSSPANTFYVLRHGQAEQNVMGILSSDVRKQYHLTDTGKKQAEKAGKALEKEKIDYIFCSPILRARETAQIISDHTGVEIVVDAHLREHEITPFEGKNVEDYRASFKNPQDRYTKKMEGGESFEEMEERVLNFVNYLNKKYRGKKIVLVTHGDVIRSIRRHMELQSVEDMFKTLAEPGEMMVMKSGPLPLRGEKLDLHKPYIDEIEFPCGKCEGTQKRVPEVLDCWFESGAMPYAQLHYPFENRDDFEKNFPAQFIGEGLDQTRGWFYTLHVLASILFDKPAFENVVVNGILLAADGEKLSKRKKNYPDPHQLFETQGVDATRFFLLSSTATLAEDVRFSENHVLEIVKQFTLTLWNTFSFLVTYANIDGWTPSPQSHQQPLARQRSQKTEPPQHALDRWILSELQVLITETTAAMDDYNLSRATRPFLKFVENLSNWYVRRSRRRFWKSESDADKMQAYETLYNVLVTVSKLLAPFTPFTADALYKNLTKNCTDKESVHLEDWPVAKEELIDPELNEEMELVRTIVRLGHGIRSKNRLKVRQPLKKISIALPKHINRRIVERNTGVILEELNVKELEFLQGAGEVAQLMVKPRPAKIGPEFGQETQTIMKLAREGKATVEPNGTVKIGKFTLKPEQVEIGYQGKEGKSVMGEAGIVCALDTKLDESLIFEGYAREIIRNLQDLRKDAQYQVDDEIYVLVESEGEMKKAVTQFADLIIAETLARELQDKGDFEWDREIEIQIGGQTLKLAVRK